ncbi:putative MPP superfamily phosphohydrolase [Bradyrhizobium sp. GM5.1]
MDRSFVIVQISDLHLDGSGRLLATIETLNAAIRERMADFADVPDRILLITGDIVDDPAPPALDEAIAVIASFRQTGLFTDIQAIAGNHDVKRPSQRAGRHDVYDYLHLPRTSKSVYYRQAGLDLVLLDSNRASLTTLVSGNVDQSAYSAMVSDSARLSVKLAGSLGSGGRADYAEPVENLVRVLALHHHPLPQATGEGKRFLGVPDEPLMYLAAPATFLEAATSLNVDLVLHGHRHVEGLTRYSIPDPRATSSESAEAFWRTIYVLSCPSSTGQAGDDAGFNVIHFGPMSDPMSHGGRTEYRFAIARYSRPRKDGVVQAARFQPAARRRQTAGRTGFFPRSGRPIGHRDRRMHHAETESGRSIRAPAPAAPRLLCRRRGGLGQFAPRLSRDLSCLGRSGKQVLEIRTQA